MWSSKIIIEPCEPRKRCCCNCRHRIVKPQSRCELDNHYISYGECFEGWCRHWAKIREEKNERKT